jgi:hypothetical protein
VVGAHNDLHSDQGARVGEHPRVTRPYQLARQKGPI